MVATTDSTQPWLQTAGATHPAVGDWKSKAEVRPRHCDPGQRIHSMTGKTDNHALRAPALPRDTTTVPLKQHTSLDVDIVYTLYARRAVWSVTSARLADCSLSLSALSQFKMAHLSAPARLAGHRVSHRLQAVEERVVVQVLQVRHLVSQLLQTAPPYGQLENLSYHSPPPDVRVWPRSA